MGLGMATLCFCSLCALYSGLLLGRYAELFNFNQYEIFLGCIRPRCRVRNALAFDSGIPGAEVCHVRCYFYTLPARFFRAHMTLLNRLYHMLRQCISCLGLVLQCSLRFENSFNRRIVYRESMSMFLSSYFGRTVVIASERNDQYRCPRAAHYCKKYVMRSC